MQKWRDEKDTSSPLPEKHPRWHQRCHPAVLKHAEKDDIRIKEKREQYTHKRKGRSEKGKGKRKRKRKKKKRPLRRGAAEEEKKAV